jgi:hypothetical protein
MIGRVAAIALADVRIRFRRPSTAVLFLLLSASAYQWVPAPSTGRALIEINGKRALYNSAAIGMGTASLAMIFVGLVGYYVISNALRRDVQTRVGFVLASTGMRSSEYLAAKFAGNLAFLLTFIGGFMATAMGMQLLRGEAPLQPLVFAWQYVLLALPAIVVVSALSLVFESIPWLSGRIGDVVYFFLWVGTIGIIASATDDNPGGAGWLRIFDLSGFGFLMETMRSSMHTDHVSIGASNFDAAKGLFIFNGLQPTFMQLLPRIGTMLLAIPLLGVALLFFHRFDPARVRVSEKSHANWLGRLNALAKPLTRMLFAIVPTGGRASFTRSVVLETMLTLSGMPLAVVAIVVFNLGALVSPTGSLVSGMLPIAFAALAIAIADISSREVRAGTSALTRSVPLLRERFLAWKLSATLLIAFLFFAVALVRIALARPSMVLPLLVGIVFVAAAATALGIFASNPKAFVVAFLFLWYISMNDHGKNPALDFAGLYGVATPATTASYAIAAIAMMLGAALFYRARLD